ncbi:aromatic prenyltransferase [Streptomyces sp. SBT349]|uniref:aromatic prenyltransferase n=1 Tax=Streptomyces sp. SBT349 TaxID=1580539 RepID=UPI0007C6D700|nr:aromatic prenyltransferase [Streptomyces sp. SBT349]
MSGTDELADLYSAIEESAGLLDVACSRDKVWPILSAYDVIQQDIIAFRVATDTRNAGDFNCRFSLHKGVDPYAVALSEGLMKGTDHPVGSLLSDIDEHCQVDSTGVDFGVVGGFKKIWVYFPDDDFPTMSRLIDLPSMPRSLAENASLFARHGMGERVDVIGIDYQDKTVNLYFPESPEPETILAMHREIGLPEPSEPLLKLCELAFGTYTTLTWDSPRVERISFGLKAQDPMALPVDLGPKIAKFLESMRYGNDDPKNVYAAMTSTGEEYLKLQSYYRWQPRGRRAGRGYPKTRSAN